MISTFPCSVAQPPVSSSPFCVNGQVISLTLPAMSLRTFHSPVSGFFAAGVTATEAGEDGGDECVHWLTFREDEGIGAVSSYYQLTEK